MKTKYLKKTVWLVSLILCWCFCPGQNGFPCNRLEGEECIFNFPIDEDFVELSIDRKTISELEKRFDVSKVPGGKKVLIFIGVYEGNVFIYDVKGIGFEENSLELWTLKSLLHSASLSRIDSHDLDNTRLFRGIVRIWVKTVKVQTD